MKVGYLWSGELTSAEGRISIAVAKKLEALGVTVFWGEPNLVSGVIKAGCDIIYGSSAESVRAIKEVQDKCPHIPLVIYSWDLYPWAVRKQRRYRDWIIPLLRKSKKILCPSRSVVYRLEGLGLGDRCEIVPAYVELFEDDKKALSNDGYVYRALRNYGWDSNYLFLKRACQHLDIPVDGSIHSLSYEDFKMRILKASFLVSDANEASTGGLSLIQGYYHGKNVLISDSKYQGAGDYFGDRAYYFEDGNFEDFEKKVNMLWQRSISRKNCGGTQDRRSFCQQYSLDNMAGNILMSFRRQLGLKV